MNYYEILRINKNSSLYEIKNAYKSQKKRYSLETYSGNKKFAEKKLKEIQEAFEVLSDLKKREEYDKLNYEKSIIEKSLNKVNKGKNNKDSTIKEESNEENLLPDNRTIFNSFSNINLYEEYEKGIEKIFGKDKFQNGEELVAIVIILLFIFIVATFLKN